MEYKYEPRRLPWWPDQSLKVSAKNCNLTTSGMLFRKKKPKTILGRYKIRNCQYLSKMFGDSTSQSKFTNMSMIRFGSWQMFSSKLSTVIFCTKLGWRTFSRTRRTSIGKNIPTSDFIPDLYFRSKVVKIAH